LLFAKLGDTYCHGCGKQIKPQNIQQIVDLIKKTYITKKVFLLQEIGIIDSSENLAKFVKKNRSKVDKGKGFTRYLLMPKENKSDPIEYFYLEEPNVPQNYFPIKIYGIYDRVTVQENRIPRLKEDIIKILSESKKFGIYSEEGDVDAINTVSWFTDKMYCADCNIVYPEFTPQHFSPNRQE
jgi:excinuclease ABC subunit A